MNLLNLLKKKFLSLIQKLNNQREFLLEDNMNHAKLDKLVKLIRMVIKQFQGELLKMQSLHKMDGKKLKEF